MATTTNINGKTYVMEDTIWDYIESILKKNAELREALIAHRLDLHCRSKRPCSTCEQSARALGIDVPNHCAFPESDNPALEKLKPKQGNKSYAKFFEDE